MKQLTKQEIFAVSGSNMECFCEQKYGNVFAETTMVRNTEGDSSAFWCKSKCCGSLSPQNVGWSFDGSDVGFDINTPIQFSLTTGQAMPIPLKDSGSC